MTYERGLLPLSAIGHTTGAIAARKKSLMLLYSFIVVFVYKVMTGYAPGVVSIRRTSWAMTELKALPIRVDLRLAHRLDALPPRLHEHHLARQLWLVDRVYAYPRVSVRRSR